LQRGDEGNISIMYTLPTSGDAKDFVLSKFDPIIQTSQKLRDKVWKDPLSRRAVYSAGLKRIGGSHFFFRGSWAEHAAQTIDADILVVDELDFQKPEVRDMYEERLAGSGSDDIIYWIGTPTLPQWGISEIFDRSDQRQWHIACPKCKKEQFLTWPDNVSFKKQTFICKFCRTDFSDEDRKNGRWIAMNPESKIHGYQITRMMAPWVPASKMIESYHKKPVKDFYNYNLGLPYIEKTQQFSRDDFQKAIFGDDEEAAFVKEKSFIAIDQGNNFNVIGGHANKAGILIDKAGLFTSAAALEKELGVQKADVMVMDMYPDQHYAMKLQEQYGKQKFFLINQRIWTETKRLQNYMEYERVSGIINLERTNSLDRLMDAIRSRTIVFSKNLARLEEILKHIQNLIPDVQTRSGRSVKVYKKIGREDYCWCLNFLLTAAEVLYPDLGGTPQTIPSYELTDSERQQTFIERDFEKAIQKVTGSDTIIIPPKSF